MNINKDTLTSFLYKNLVQNTEITNNTLIDETFENINKTQNQNVPLLSSTDELKILLNSINQAPSKENMELIKILVQNNLPITKENLEDIIKSTKIFKDFPIEKALFLIENNIKPTINIGNQIDNYISKDTALSKQIENLFSDISFLDSKNLSFEKIFNNTSFENLSKSIINDTNNLKMQFINHFKNGDFKNLTNILNNITKNTEDTSNLLKQILDININEDLLIHSNKLENLKQIFSNDTNLNNITDNIIKNNISNLNDTLDKQAFNILQKEILNILKSNPKISNKFKDILNNFDNFQNKLKFFDFKNSSTEDLNEFFEEIAHISKNINENMANMGENKIDNLINNLDNLNKNIDFMNNMKNNIFLQIPLNINNFSTTAELFVFSNKKNKNKSSKNNSGSALLSLNLLNLGKLEVYINKINNDISCQFRLENDNTKNIVKNNIQLLNNYLKNKNLTLKDVSFKDLDESFTLISQNKTKDVLSNFKLSNFNAKA
nr:flagellar hook-length control protein FliK [uncultured Tyzzerella sp.]